jgi:hypothetical protein
VPRTGEIRQEAAVSVSTWASGVLLDVAVGMGWGATMPASGATAKFSGTASDTSAGFSGAASCAPAPRQDFISIWSKRRVQKGGGPFFSLGASFETPRGCVIALGEICFYMEEAYSFRSSKASSSGPGNFRSWSRYCVGSFLSTVPTFSPLALADHLGLSQLLMSTRNDNAALGWAPLSFAMPCAVKLIDLRALHSAGYHRLGQNTSLQ